MLDPKKRLIDCNLEDLGEYIDTRIKSNQIEEPITTKQLCEKRNIKSPGLLTYYKSLGLKEAGYNRWYLSKYDEWYENVYSKMITPRRKKK